MLNTLNPAPNKPSAPPTGFALWNLGFRPFYLLASLFSVLSVLLWAGQFSGLVPGLYLSNPIWHGHEMLFGYTTAVIAGFLLTAVGNWTGKKTPSKTPLMLLAVLWIAGRVLVLTPWPMLAALVNAAFPLAVGVAIAIPLWRSQNKRNYFFVGLMVVMSLLILAMHLAMQGKLDFSPQRGLYLELDLVLFIMAVMGGRVIPMFTNNGIPGTQAVRSTPVERVALGAILLLFVIDLLQLPPIVDGAVALVACVAHARRLWLWQPWRTRVNPLVWILHAAYAWIVVYLLLRGLTSLGVLSGPYAVHALTVGAIGGLTLGMMTRTARGHTGRLLVVDRFEVACYVLVLVAALVRVFGGMLLPGAYLATVVVSGLCWSTAFAIYAVRYWPVLSRPRLDGKPG